MHLSVVIASALGLIYIDNLVPTYLGGFSVIAHSIRFGF